MKRMMIAVLGVSTMVGFAGCGSTDDSAGTEADVEDEELDALVARTVMWRAADGSLKTREETVTRRQQLAEFSGRLTRMNPAAAATGGIEAQSGALNDTLGVVSCSNDDSLWLFDAVNLGGRQLCLLRDAANDPLAWLFLSTVRRGVLGNWDAATRSLWAGVDAGALQNCTPSLCYTTGHFIFSAWQRANSLTPATLHVAYLHE